ncbi:MAG: PDZ domain-containing protein [Fuerstia sp.]|nr:PDZ domain-containing protein [Fuerstiella sp.]
MRIHYGSFVRAGFCAALLVAAQVDVVCGQDAVSADAVPPEASAAVDSTRDVIEAIIKHHLEPPARQQLILEVLRGIADATSQQLPGDLSAQISGISDIDALYSLLNEEKDRLGLKGQPNEKVEKAVQQRLNRVVPGGVQIVPTRDYVVNEQLAANRYVGIGVRVSMDGTSQRMQLMEVVEDGPAETTGLKAGDVIESVDAKDTFKVSIDEVIQWLRGPEESVVKLTVRSPRAEAREVEVVRGVVPFETLHLIPQSDNAAVALIRLDRLSASTVHELRKIVGELPEAVSTVILDLRFCTDGSLHHLHLLADALLEDGHLGDVETRSGVRPLNTEAGTVLEGRKPVLVYQPGHSEQVDWLATVVQEKGVAVFRGEFAFRENPEERKAVSQSIVEFVPSSDGTHYIGLATARLLTSDGKPLDREKPVGILLERAVPADLAAIRSWSDLIGVGREMKSLQSPLAVVTNRDGTQSFQSLPRGFQLPKASATDKTLIDQIMLHVNTVNKE